MLVLSRNNGEAIILYTREGTITIRTKAINNSRVLLSIDAPASINILREELT